MTRDWENTFRSWGKPPSETEQAKCENAERAIRKAINTSPALSTKNTKVFPQGSYRRRTNVRIDSDVDICVVCTNTFIFHLPDGMTRDRLRIDYATYPYSNYKRDVEDALVSHFGSGAIKRGNKAFDVHENTYRVDADVVACFEHRRYRADGTYITPTGTAFYTDAGLEVINWPEHNYKNGVEKNTATSQRFKALVRILKRLRNEMGERGIVAAKPIPSYLLECLVWNVPNEAFGHNTYTTDVRWVLGHLLNYTRRYDDCKEWGEINELKYLFRNSQQWTREQANSFLNASWEYIGFK